MDYGVIMDKKETIQDIATKLKIIYDMIKKSYVEYEYGEFTHLKQDKKDYKYSKEWDEIKRGNDYY